MLVSKEVLKRTLNGILSPVVKTRENNMKKLETLKAEGTDEFGIQLIKCVIDTTSSPAIAELASETLKNYIERHWSTSSSEFKPPEVGSEGQATIKKGLFVGLRSSNSKVRHEVAGSIAVIVHSNWTKNFPEIFGTLVKYLNDESESARLGSMQVFTKFTRYVTETQLVDMGPTILKEMTRIWNDKEQSMSIRQQATQTFVRMVTRIPGNQQPEVVLQHLKPSIAMFCAKFVDTLKIGNDATTETQIKILIIDTIRVITEESPKCIADFLPKIAPLIWNVLMDCAEVHQESVLNVRKGEIPQDLDDLVLAIFKFIRIMIDERHSYDLNQSGFNLQDDLWFHLRDSLPLEALHHVIMLIEVNDKQVELWTQDSNKFVEEEKSTDKSRNPCSLRGKAQATLLKILDRPERNAENANRLINALFDVILKQVEEGNAMRNSGKSGERKNWWKLHEACIQMFGMMKDRILEKQKAGTLSFNVATFLENVVLVNLGDSEIHPLLFGRCLYVGGVYALEMPKGLRSKFLEATINGLNTQYACTRILAANAVLFWLHAFTEESDRMDEVLPGTYLPALCEGLINLGNQLMSIEVVMIVLTNFAALIPLNEAFTASAENAIYGLTFAAFINFPGEYRMSEICKTVFCKLAQNSNCISPLVTRLVPTLVGKLNVSPPRVCDNGKIKAAALDVLTSLVENSPQPLSDLLIKSAFPVSCQFILRSFHTYILLKGSKLIRAFLDVAPQQVLGFKDINGQTGSQCVVRVVTHFFTYQSSHRTCAGYSRCLMDMLHGSKDLQRTATDVVILLVNNHTLQENSDLLLEGVLDAICVILRFWCELDIPHRLLMAYAHMFNTNFETVFNFLSSTKKLTDQNALAYIISEGFCDTFKGLERENQKLVTLVLSKVLTYSMIHPDLPIHKMIVKEGPWGTETTSVPLLFKVSRIVTDEITRHINDCEEKTRECKQEAQGAEEERAED